MLKKTLIILICVIILAIVALISIIVMESSEKKSVSKLKKISISGINTDYIVDDFDEEYEVYINESIIGSFDNYEDACALCMENMGSVVKKKGSDGNLYENIYRYEVVKNDEKKEFKNISEAFSYVNVNGGFICDTLTGNTVYEKINLSWSHKIYGVERIGQYPELHRGCEITSLCMLFKYRGINKSKTELANEIIKDKTPFRDENGIYYYGNPNTGFVGDIYSKDNKGYGVYHKPIYNLALSYFGKKAEDLTGTEPQNLYYLIEKNCPVWVIVNSKFKPLTSEFFEKWHTSEGEIQITYSEHSVLITGYDSNYVYFNDPMHPETEGKAERLNFEQAWIQMGSQAVTVFE